MFVKLFNSLPVLVRRKVIFYVKESYTHFIIRRAVDYNNRRVTFLEKVLKRAGEFNKAWRVILEIMDTDDLRKRYVAWKKLVSEFEEKYDYDFLAQYFNSTDNTYDLFVKRTRFIISTLKKLNDHYFYVINEYLENSKLYADQEIIVQLVRIQEHLQRNAMRIEVPAELLGGEMGELHVHVEALRCYNKYGYHIY